MSVLPVDLMQKGVTGPTISIVLPMRNEAAGLDRLFDRIVPVLNGMATDWEIVTVDDGSTDETLARLKAFRAKYPTLRIVSLSRNFGKEIAVTAGIAKTTGRVVVLMDSDLQHPPEAIPSLVEPWKNEGYAVVYARRLMGASRRILH